MLSYNLIVIGGGPAGMAVAYSAYQAGLKKILLIERQAKLGGILNQCIHIGFGLHYFKEELTGTEYAARYRKLLLEADIEIVTSSFVVKVESPNIVTYINRSGEFSAQGKYLVLATGCRERTREMLTVPGTRPAGIFTAGLAQEMINLHGLLPGKKVVLVGSGDIGLIMARRLTLEGAKVLAVLEINKNLSGLIRNKIQCLDDFNIPLLCEHELLEIAGKNRVEGIRFIDRQNGTEKSLACDTILFSVGLIPEKDLLVDAGLEPDENLFVIGNAAYIHDLADKATKEAEELGKKIADKEGVNHY
ncbi:MAG: FAD-dependent oxidoreductase [Candidatus Margulisbacteria bacterium]|nr:FAD-dependent oxidoreductase [Candidatus Margulisiibacteriota bacterium]